MATTRRATHVAANYMMEWELRLSAPDSRSLAHGGSCCNGHVPESFVVSTWTREAWRVSGRRWPRQTVPPHDLQQAGVIGQFQILRGLRHVPIALFERGNQDLPLSLGLPLEKAAP